MILAPLEMSVPAGDGLILMGTLTYPTRSSGAGFPLADLAHQYPSTRDSYSPLLALDVREELLPFLDRSLTRQ